MEEKSSCACSIKIGEGAKENDLRKKGIFLGLALIGWWVLYQQLLPAAQWVTYSLFGLTLGTHLAEATAFFLYDVPKVFMLLILIVFGVGLLRSFLPRKRPGTSCPAKGNRRATCWPPCWASPPPFAPVPPYPYLSVLWRRVSLWGSPFPS